MKIGFIFLAQSHQIFHSLPVACALARLYPEVEVTLLARSQAQKNYLVNLAKYYEAENLHYRIVAPPFPWSRVAPEASVPKTLTLLWNLRTFSRFDSLVMPERTSLALRKMGLRRTKFIHTTHGAGDDERDWDTRMREFDLVLLPGRKRRDRLLQLGLIRPGHYCVSGYNKFDLITRIGGAHPPVFDNGRKTVLYTPHHNKTYSSWHLMGRQVLQYFAKSDRYNLIFAPHIRLFADGDITQAELRPYRGHAHMLIDPGSERSVDMSYSLASDIYIGDWSSQIYEFLLRPRPAIFLNPQQLDWQGKEEFLWWTLGQVTETISGLDNALTCAEELQAHYEPLQKAAFDYSFASFPETAPVRAANAIMTFLKQGSIPGDLM